jgi:hypothetical protein
MVADTVERLWVVTYESGVVVLANPPAAGRLRSLKILITRPTPDVRRFGLIYVNS